VIAPHKTKIMNISPSARGSKSLRPREKIENCDKSEILRMESLIVEINADFVSEIS
jgi:hypothetical protein